MAAGYEGVREAFAADPRGGSALAVLRHGEVVVDLREGWRDAARTVPWDADTLVNVYSVGKPVIALAALLLVERGLIGLGRSDGTALAVVQDRSSVRQVLTHTSGLATFEVPAAGGGLAGLGSAVRRPGRRPTGVAARHGRRRARADLWAPARRVGPPGRRPPAGQVRGRGDRRAVRCGLRLRARPGRHRPCAELEFDAPDWPERQRGEPGSVRARAVQYPAGARDLAVVNSDLWRSASVPAVNLHSTAIALARFYAELMDRPIGATMATAQFEGIDLFIGSDDGLGAGRAARAGRLLGNGRARRERGLGRSGRGHAIAYVTRRLGDFAAVDRIEAALAAGMS